MTVKSAAAPMKILMVIARYPPHHGGGYELRCRDTARVLVRKGHQVTVLTSRDGKRGVEDDDGVRVVRELTRWPEGPVGRGQTLRFILSTRRDCGLFRKWVERSEADVVHYWHQCGLTSALLAMPRPDGCGVLCDVSSVWLQDLAGTGGNWFRIWEHRAGTLPKRALKAFLRPLVGAFLRVPTRRPKFPPGRCYFTSEDRLERDRAAGFDLDDATVITSGIDLRRFRFVEGRPTEGPRFVLFLGRLKRWKGLHTVVLALRDLPEDVRLRVVGGIDDPSYVAEIAELGRATGVMGRIELAQPVPHEQVAGILAAGHVLVFPSEEPEPFSRLVLESFAVGTPVVGTTLGGTGEVLIEGRTGLTFDPGNAHQLAAQLQRLLSDAALRDSLVDTARKLVRQRYSIGFTVDQIAELLRGAIARARPDAPAGAD